MAEACSKDGLRTPRRLERVQRIPIPKANSFWKGSRTRRKYGWNADKRLELKLVMRETPAQTACTLAGPHQSLAPTALGPEALQGVTEPRRKGGQQEGEQGQASLRTMMNRIQKRPGLGYPQGRQGTSQAACRTPPNLPSEEEEAAISWVADILLERQHNSLRKAHGL